MYTLYAVALVLLNLLVMQIAAQSSNRGMTILNTASITAPYQGRGRSFGFDIDGGVRAHVAIGPNLFGVSFDNLGAMGNPIWSSSRSDDAIAGVVYDSANNSLIVCTQIYREVYRLTLVAGQVTSSELIRSKSWTNSRYWNGCSMDPTSGALFIAASQEMGCWPNINRPATNAELSEPYYSNDLNSQLYSPLVEVHAGKVYFGDSLIFVTSTSNYQLSNSQINQYSVSSGQIQSMAVSQSSNRLYVGTDQGTLVEMSLNTMSLSRTSFVDDAAIYSIIIDDNARTLFVNAVSKSSPTTSKIIRYNLNENLLRSFGLFSFPDGVSVNYGTLDVRAGKYQMLFSNFDGDTVTSIRTVSCSNYDCSTCQEDTNYCGYCTASRACVTSDSCSSSNFFRQDYVCPALFSISPSSGSTDGGTQVTVTGQFTDFSGTPLTSGFECQWGTGTRISAVIVNAATLRCTSPSGNAGDASFRVFYVGSLWTTTSLTYSYYSCSALTTSNPCTTCFSAAECGICLPTMQCSSFRGCSNGFTKSCTVITSISPESASIVGNNNLTITLDQHINAHYQCMYSGTPALASTPTPAIFVRPNTLSCKPPTVIPSNWLTARGTSRDLLVDLVIKVSTSSAVLALKAKAIYLFDCDTFQQDCSSCTSSRTNKECAFCSDELTCHYNVSTSCTTNGTCPVITSVSPARIFSGNLAMALTISMTGRFLSLREQTIICAWNSVGDSMGSLAYTVRYEPSLISCVIPTTLGVGLHSISLWIYKGAYLRVVPNFPVEVYLCSGTSCTTCLSPSKPECVFCSSSANCTHSSTACSSEKIALSSSCPSISSVSPSSSRKSGNVTVVVQGSFNPTVLDHGVSCQWSSSFTITTPPLYIDVNEVRCIAPAFPAAAMGTVTLAVNNNAWSNSLPFLWHF